MNWFWDWVYRITHRHQIEHDLCEMETMVENWKHMRSDMERRITEVFTPEEYEAVRRRCEAQLGRWGNVR